MARGRCVVFLQVLTIEQYEDLASRVGESRSFLMRYILERGLDDAKSYVSHLLATGVALPERPSPAPPSRRRGRPTRAARLKNLADLQALVQRHRDAAPDIDRAGIRRFVEETARVVGGRPSPTLLEQALDTIFAQRADDPPEPVGGYRPPE